MLKRDDTASNKTDRSYVHHDVFALSCLMELNGHETCVGCSWTLGRPSRSERSTPASITDFSPDDRPPVSTVRDLGIFVDRDLLMRTHVCRTVSYWFAMLRQLCSIHYLVSASVFQSLVTALVLCLHGNNTLIGLPSTTPPVGLKCRPLV